MSAAEIRDVYRFIKLIQPQAFGSKQKQRISDFLDSFFKYKPDFDIKDIRYLMEGSVKKKGLLVSCGNTNLKTVGGLKRSSILALQLLSRLLSNENPHIQKYIQVLCKVPLDLIVAMKLDRHILSPNRVSAFSFIDVLVQHTEFSLEDYIPDAVARNLYEAYARKREDEEDPESEPDEPTTWADIKELEDPEKEEQAGFAEMDETSGHEKADAVDPLGLRGVLQIDRRRRKKRGVLDGTNKGSIDTSDEDFNPALFLTEVHQNTSFEDLQVGLKTLKTAVKGRSDDVRKLVKDHFRQYVNCKDTIDNIYTLLQGDPGRTARLQTLLEKIQLQATQCFKPLLERKEQADRIRTTLVVLRRFRFLFSLPGSIRQGILEEDYGKVVRDYKKAKSLRVDESKRSKNDLPTEVLQEVKRLISEVRKELFKKLDNPSAYLEDQQRVIEHLTELDCKEDPAEYYLSKQKEWICSMLRKCYEEHIRTVSGQGDDFAAFSKKEEAQSSYMVELSLNRFVRKLCLSLIKNMPGFYKLAQKIATRKFSKNSASPELSGAGSNLEVKSLIASINNLYISYVRFAIFPDHPEPSSSSATKAETLVRVTGFMPLPPSVHENVNQTLRSYHILKELGMPTEYVSDLKILSDQIVTWFVQQSFTNTLILVSDLHRKEDWVLDRDVPGTTPLLQKFKTLIETSLKSMESIPSKTLETMWIVELIAAPFLECLRAFADVLHTLAFGSAVVDSDPKFGDRKLLATLNNAVYAGENIFPPLCFRLRKMMPKSTHSLLIKNFKKVADLLHTLSNAIASKYIRSKTLALNSILKQGLSRNVIYESEPKEVRSYVLELLLQLVFTHNELHAMRVVNDEIETIMEDILEGIALTFEDCVKDIDAMNPLGAFQVLIEMEFIKTTLFLYLKDESEATFDSIHMLLERASGQNFNDILWRQKRNNILSSVSKSTEVMFECFKQQEKDYDPVSSPLPLSPQSRRELSS